MAAKGKPKTKGSGRDKGTPNKITAEVKTLAQKHGKAAIDKLVHVMKNGKTEIAQARAANWLLDRGYGKPAQTIEVEGNLAITMKGMSDGQLADRVATLEQNLGRKRAK